MYRQRTPPLFVIGASTGGTQALEVVIRALPPDGPPVAIVQHMPAHFTRQFAERLDEISVVSVAEATAGATLDAGLVLIAPGSAHLVIRRAGTRYFCELRDGPPVSRHRPAVDVLFRSAALAGGPNVAAALLTGMWSDGAQGLLELRRAGASTCVQDEATCVVFGMPKAAIELGAAQLVLPLDRISGHLLAEGRRRGGAAA